MKNVSAAIACFCFTLALAAPALNAQKPLPATRNRPSPADATTPAASNSPLETILSDLVRVSEATDSDLANLQFEDHSGSWKNAWHFWHRGDGRKHQVQQAADSLKANLHDAMPGLIHDAHETGTFAASFKLYNNMNVVCELLDSLVENTRASGKKGEEGPLVNDSAAMGRIRQDLANYVEQAANLLDSKTRESYAGIPSSTGKPKKIIVDDTAPAKKPKKKTAATTPPQ